MTKLKLGEILDDKPVKLTVELPAALFRDLTAYAAILAKITGTTTAIEPSKLVVPMLERFMATGRVSAKARKSKAPTTGRQAQGSLSPPSTGNGG